MKFDAIILAAGRGKRMKPFSDSISKPMLPLLNKPLVSIVAEQLLRIGAQKIVITVSTSNEAEIRSYFQAQAYAEKIVYCLQDPPQGTAEAIYKAGLLCSSNVIYSMAGDNLFSEIFCNQMVEEFFSSQNTIQCIMALMEVTKEEMTKLASVKTTESGLITGIVEKPKLEEVESTLASLSMYIFKSSLLKYFGSVPLSPRGEYEAPDAFLAMIAKKESIILRGLVTHEQYVHISNPEDLWRYNMEFLGINNDAIAEQVTLGSNVIIKHSVIGQHSIIGENCLIENSVILKGVSLPPHSIIRNAIVGPSTTTGIEKITFSQKDD